MATFTVIDPVTRIEGHMKVEVKIEDHQVVDAECSGTLFRGFETILNGRDPADAPVITPRICGVCPISHAIASVSALDAVSKRLIPENARIMRNLTLGANFLQSHILHFYLLAALDYIKGPDKAPWNPAWNHDFIDDPSLRGVLDNYVKAIEARRRAHEMGALFAGKMPTSHAFISGGFTATPTRGLITKYKAHLDWLTKFIDSTYIPDVQKIGAVYSEYFDIGGGYKNLLAYGVFPLNQKATQKLFKAGFVQNGKKGIAAAIDQDQIKEFVTNSWYEDSSTNQHPSKGKTLPVNPKVNAYSWLKSPRYKGLPGEVGALARMWVNGDYQAGVSVMDRHVARALEARKIAVAMAGWLKLLKAGKPVYDNGVPKTAGTGVGLTEAPRGALGHWVNVSANKIVNYQIITPTCWNASPRDDKSQMGPMEKALIGTPVADPDRPIEVLRVVHSFDPCLSCAVHVMRPKKVPLIIPVAMA